VDQRYYASRFVAEGARGCIVSKIHHISRLHHCALGEIWDMRVPVSGGYMPLMILKNLYLYFFQADFWGKGVDFVS
jgi:hypothetical protein